MLRTLFALSFAGYCFAEDATLTNPSPRSEVSGYKKYTDYTIPSSGILGCGVGDSNTFCQTLETCDASTIGTRSTITQGGFATVEWVCSSSTTTTTMLDDEGTNSGMTVAIKCGASSSFFENGNFLDTRFNAGCYNTTTTRVLNNAFELGDKYEGNCVLLWVWELTPTGGGFYMGCSDIILEKGESGTLPKNSQADYDTVGAITAMVIPLIFLLIVGFVVFCFRKSLPEWLPYIQYAFLGFWAICGFSAGVAVNDFEGNGSLPLASPEVRFGTWMLFLSLIYGALLIIQRYFVLFQDSLVLQFLACGILLFMVFIAGGLNALNWEGRNEYCTFSDSDEFMCNSYKFFVCACWMVFALLMVKFVTFTVKIFSGEAEREAIDAIQAGGGYTATRGLKSPSAGIPRGNTAAKKQHFYRMDGGV